MPFASLGQGEAVIVALLKLLTADVVSWGEELECLLGESAKAILLGGRGSVRESDYRRGEGETRARSG